MTYYMLCVYLLIAVIILLFVRECIYEYRARREFLLQLRLEGILDAYEDQSIASKSITDETIINGIHLCFALDHQFAQAYHGKIIEPRSPVIVYKSTRIGVKNWLNTKPEWIGAWIEVNHKGGLIYVKPKQAYNWWSILKFLLLISPSIVVNPWPNLLFLLAVPVVPMIWTKWDPTFRTSFLKAGLLLSLSKSPST